MTGYNDALRRAVRILSRESRAHLSQTDGRLEWALGFCDAYAEVKPTRKRDPEWTPNYQRGYDMGATQEPSEWEKAYTR